MWILFYDESEEAEGLTFYLDGRLESSLAGTGLWLQRGCDVVWSFGAGTRFRGTLWIDGNFMEGDSWSPSGTTRRWTALRIVDFMLDLNPVPLPGSVRLEMTLSTPEPAVWWTSYIIGANPGFERIPLWRIPVPRIDPPAVFSLELPLPAADPIGIFSGLTTAEGIQVFDFGWIVPE